MKKRARRALIIAGSVAGAAALCAAAFAVYSSVQMSRIPDMTFSECLEYTTGGNKNAVITVGTISGGKASWSVYGQDGKPLPQELHTYEAGSLTKTFTAALTEKAAREGLLSLDAPLNSYLPLPEKAHYPDIRSLLTHTSGYSAYYYESPMTGNFFSGANSFRGIGDSMVLDRLGKVDITPGQHGFDYSNFGYATLGLVLENVYQTEFTRLMNDFCAEMGLNNTHITECSGDLGGMWEWEPGDTYLAAGGLVTDIEDMLKYAQLCLDGEGAPGECQKPLTEINAASESYKSMGIRMDDIGMAWLIDRENGFIWHNGGTGSYNSYLGFSPEKGTAVVILSNLAPGERIPSTVMGAKLLKEISD